MIKWHTQVSRQFHSNLKQRLSVRLPIELQLYIATHTRCHQRYVINSLENQVPWNQLAVSKLKSTTGANVKPHE